MKHLLFLLMFAMAVPAIANEENDTIIYYNNKQFVVSTDSIETHVAVFNKDGNALVKNKETSYIDGQEVERFFVSSPFVPIRKHKNNTFYGNIGLMVKCTPERGHNALFFIPLQVFIML